MVGFRYLIILSLLISSCAQVGSISGGEVDNSAPKPIEKSIEPANGATNFDHTKIIIPYDEFFKLNQPGNNIKIVPPGPVISSSVKGKTLTLDLEGALQENTTYAIYLNGAVKDITEGNDSVYQYVFSTGPKLDSLSYGVFVQNAWTGLPEKGITVGLYQKDTLTLVSLAQTDENGEAKLSYLAHGNYQLFAFEDLNGDLIPQPYEKVGFQKETTISVDSNLVDSIPLRLYKPLEKPKITSTKLLLPGAVLIGANRDFVNASFKINGVVLPDEQVNELARDSVRLSYQLRDEKKLEVIVQSKEINDTLSLRTPVNGNRKITLSPSISSHNFSPWDSLEFICNDFIIDVDPDQIVVLNALDSTPLNSRVVLENGLLQLHLNRDSVQEVRILFKEGALETLNGTNSEQSFVLALSKARKFGSLNVDLNYYESTPTILLIYAGKKLIKTLPLSSTPKKLLVNGLLPGELTIKVIQDANKNSVWDVGDLSSRTLPETIDHYSSPVKVRANWEVDVTLIPKNE